MTSLTEDVEKYLWCSIYKGEINKLKSIPVEHLAVTIINVSLVIATKCVGSFPQAIWMCRMTRMQPDLLKNLSDIVLKVVLGK